MKTYANTLVVEFNPVQLQLTLENIDELSAVYALLCHAVTSDVLREAGIEPKVIRDRLAAAYGSVPPYSPWFNKFNNAIRKA